MRSIIHPNKKGAIELSIGTMVVIVLGMSMLILGIVLVRSIFTGATGAVELVNKNVESEINKLFAQDSNIRTAVYLPDGRAEVKQGVSYNVRFGIKNTDRGDSTGGNEFRYTVKSKEVEQGCRGLTLEQASKYLKLGVAGSATLIPGADPKEQVVVLQIPEDAPLCLITYEIEVRRGAEVYDTNSFIVDIK